MTFKSEDLIGKMIYGRNNAVQEELNYLEVSSISDIQEQEIEINSDQLVGESSGSTEIPDESSSVTDRISEGIPDGVETLDSTGDEI